MNAQVESVPIGQLPPPGVVPRRMDAWVIRPDREGEPRHAMRRELVDTPEPGPGEALVLVMAAGVNYNGIWAAAGRPVSMFDVHRSAYHVAGSDASGVVWKVGPGVERVKPGDHVVIHCNVTCGECGACNGSDPMACEGQQIWGYETPGGSFAQFTCVQAQQLLPKPREMTWESAASYGLVCFTAYRMLVDRARVRPGEVVLVWGATGGLGAFALQIARLLGATPIAVVSSDEKARLARELGAAGCIDRSAYPDLPFRPPETPERARARQDAAKRFGRAIWEVLGEKRAPDVIFEHVGQETFPTSVFLAGRLGRIVICGATSGYMLSFDVRHVWMRQKMIIGSHFAHAGQCQRANDLIAKGKIRPTLTKTYPYRLIPEAHEEMRKNQHVGTLACLVSAPREGLKSLEETAAAATRC